jgi:transposase
MARYLSEDLRVRVIEAVRTGASRRQAAARFGVSVSSAIRWVAEWRASGRTAPRAQGGDRRSDRVEAEAGFLLARLAETPDVTLAQMREALWRERGVRVAVSTLWRFFDRRRITLKKRLRMRPSRSAPT